MPAGFACQDRLRQSLEGSSKAQPTESSSRWEPITIPHVTDWRFLFHCSPPCVATTQLRFNTSRLLTARKGTFTPLSVCLLRRTSGDVRSPSGILTASKPRRSNTPLLVFSAFPAPPRETCRRPSSVFLTQRRNAFQRSKGQASQPGVANHEIHETHERDGTGSPSPPPFLPSSRASRLRVKTCPIILHQSPHWGTSGAWIVHAPEREPRGFPVGSPKTTAGRSADPPTIDRK